MGKALGQYVRAQKVAARGIFHETGFIKDP